MLSIESPTSPPFSSYPRPPPYLPTNLIAPYSQTHPRHHETLNISGPENIIPYFKVKTRLGATKEKKNHIKPLNSIKLNIDKKKYLKKREMYRTDKVKPSV